MLTFRELNSCEGYYYDVTTGDILRNVGPGQSHCWSEGSWVSLDAGVELDSPRYELLTTNVSVAFATVQRLAAEKYGLAPSGYVINRQTAIQPGGDIATEEATILIPGPRNSDDR